MSVTIQTEAQTFIHLPIGEKSTWEIKKGEESLIITSCNISIEIKGETLLNTVETKIALLNKEISYWKDSDSWKYKKDSWKKEILIDSICKEKVLDHALSSLLHIFNNKEKSAVIYLDNLIESYIINELLNGDNDFFIYLTEE